MNSFPFPLERQINDYQSLIIYNTASLVLLIRGSLPHFLLGRRALGGNLVQQLEISTSGKFDYCGSLKRNIIFATAGNINEWKVMEIRNIILATR